MIKRALVPGTFDPITFGHLDVIERTCKLFDEVIVGIAYSKSKKGNRLFSIEERVKLAQQTTAHLPKVRVISFGGLLVDCARAQQVNAIVKGLRTQADFEMEMQMASLNKKLDNKIESLFIMSDPEHRHISSTVVRELAFLGADISDMVAPAVEQAIQNKFGAQRD